MAINSYMYQRLCVLFRPFNIYPYLCVVALPAQHDWNGADNFIKVFPMNFSLPKGFCSGFLFLFFPLIHVEPA